MVHFGPDLDVASRIVLDEPPAQPLRIEQIKPQIAASQRTVRDLQAAA
jgi:hypothetical protein